MRFCSLGSGSTGNALVVEAASGATATRLLVDCGFTLREADARLARAGIDASGLDAIFVTHEHGDHVGAALSLAKRERLPVWMSRGTWRAIGEPALPDGLLRLARDGEAIQIGDLELHPYTVPHDAAEPLQLTCGDGASTLGVLTDAGMPTPHIIDRLQRCDALVLECNHDAALLARSRYPPWLKARIGGRWGHLANEASAEVLGAVRHSGLRHVVAAHLSQENNRPELAAAALATACGATAGEIVVAHPQRGVPWLDLR